MEAPRTPSQRADLLRRMGDVAETIGVADAQLVKRGGDVVAAALSAGASWARDMSHAAAEALDGDRDDEPRGADRPAPRAPRGDASGRPTSVRGPR